MYTDQSSSTSQLQYNTGPVLTLNLSEIYIQIKTLEVWIKRGLMCEYLLEVKHLPSVVIPSLEDFDGQQDNEDDAQESDHRHQTDDRHLYGTHRPRVI